jgi:hypothetical protein
VERGSSGSENTESNWKWILLEYGVMAPDLWVLVTVEEKGKGAAKPDETF